MSDDTLDTLQAFLAMDDEAIVVWIVAADIDALEDFMGLVLDADAAGELTSTEVERLDPLFERAQRLIDDDLLVSGSLH